MVLLIMNETLDDTVCVIRETFEMDTPCSYPKINGYETLLDLYHQLNHHNFFCWNTI